MILFFSHDNAVYYFDLASAIHGVVTVSSWSCSLLHWSFPINSKGVMQKNLHYCLKTEGTGRTGRPEWHGMVSYGHAVIDFTPLWINKWISK